MLLQQPASVTNYLFNSSLSAVAYDMQGALLFILSEYAIFTFHFQIEERKKQLKKEGKDSRVDEDDPEKLKRAVYVQTMKLFADMERKRRQQEVRDQEERKRKRDQEIAEEEQKKAEKEWQKNFEVTY